MSKSKKFLKLIKETRKRYLGKPVPKKWQKRYGKIYDEDEVHSMAYAIAVKKGWRT